MRGFLQAVCVVAIALGAGLFATGNYLEPRLDPSNPAQFAHWMARGSDERIASSVLRGFGIGFMILGALGLAVPWVNALVFRQRRPEIPAQPAAEPNVEAARGHTAVFRPSNPP